MECACGGTKAVKLVDGIGLVMCLSCGRGSHIYQPKLEEVAAYRSEVSKLMEIDRLRRDMNKGLAQSALAEIIGSEGATQVIQGAYQGGEL